MLHHSNGDPLNVSDVAAGDRASDASGASDGHETIRYHGFRMLLAPLVAGLVLLAIAALSRTNPDLQKYRAEHAKVVRQP